MAVIDDRTPLGLKKPHQNNDPYGVDVQRLRDAIDLIDTLISGLATTAANLAPLASPTLTGNPTAPTQALGNKSLRLANTDFVGKEIAAAIANLVASSPAALDTLNELATALGNDPNFATTVTNVLSTKAPLASPVLTGNPTTPTPSAGDSDMSVPNTAWTQGELAAKSAADRTYALALIHTATLI